MAFKNPDPIVNNLVDDLIDFSGSKNDAIELANSKNQKVRYRNPYWLKDIYEIIEPGQVINPSVHSKLNIPKSGKI